MIELAHAHRKNKNSLNQTRGFSMVVLQDLFNLWKALKTKCNLDDRLNKKLEIRKQIQVRFFLNNHFKKK